MNSNLKKSESSFFFKGEKKEFLEWLESLKVSKYWLDTMSYAENYALCKEIYKVLQDFKMLDLEDNEKQTYLIEVNDCLDGIYEKLHDHYLDGKLLLNKEQQAAVKMVIYTYMLLARNYYDIVSANKHKKGSLSTQQLVLLLCKGLQGLGIVFLTSSEVYTQPPQNFWLLCYRFFSTSEFFNISDNEIKISETNYSIAKLFKKLIVFYILDKNQCAPRDLDKIFQLLSHGINFIQNYVLGINDINMIVGTEIYGFSLTSDEPPSIQTKVSSKSAKKLGYVEKFEVIKIIQFLATQSQERLHSEGISSELLNRLLISLDHQKIKRQKRIHKEYNCRAIIGLDNLIEFLLEKENKTANTSNKNIKNTTYEEEADSLHLALDWNVEKELQDNNLIIDGLQIIDSSMSGYGISSNDKIINKLQIGEVIGIIPDFNSTIKRIEICLIRRINVVRESVVFGVELIGLESTLIYMLRDNHLDKGEWELFLFGLPSYEVGILSYKQRNYQKGETVFIQVENKKVQCQLGAKLNTTPLLDHIALVY